VCWPTGIEHTAAMGIVLVNVPDHGEHQSLGQSRFALYSLPKSEDFSSFSGPTYGTTISRSVPTRVMRRGFFRPSAAFCIPRSALRMSFFDIVQSVIL
jgi:hypothetical protein